MKIVRVVHCNFFIFFPVAIKTTESELWSVGLANTQLFLFGLKEKPEDQWPYQRSPDILA